jgi:hypothetical protein
MSGTLPFLADPRSRASQKPGTVYAIDGGDDFIYYGQVTPYSLIGFFRFRSKEISVADAMASEIMSNFAVIKPSIGEALRSGKWMKLGNYPLRNELAVEPVLVSWPVGTLQVTLWRGRSNLGTTQVHDSKIQDLEIIAAYDAIYHVPARLQADFDQSENAWQAGGSIRRERIKKQDLANRFPDAPWHQLPSDWVAVNPEA